MKKYHVEQQLHCCGRKDVKDDRKASITLREYDGGGGPYMVIDVDSWAIDSKAELKVIYKEMKAYLKKIRGEV